VSSMSRLPVAAGTTKKRSSSSHGAPALTELPRNAMTPSSSRSVSKRDTFTTPQRVSQAPPRMSMGGTATKRASGRGSQMGARVLKDTRPLTDKSYQLEEIKKLLDFLRRNKYANTSLTSKHFPLNTKEFVNIFNFLYSFLDPRIANKIPSAKFEEEALKTLKSLNYPGNLTKSSFVAMGSMHTWPTVLGSLSYLCDIVQMYSEKLLPKENFHAIAFPRVDEDGLPSDKTNLNQCQFDHFVECFKKFNTCDMEIEEMDFEEEISKFREKVFENQDIDLDQIQALDAKVDEQEEILKALTLEKSNLSEVLERNKATSSDIRKLEDYLSNRKQRIEEKQLEIERMPSKMEAFVEVKEQLVAEIEELKSRCNNPNLNSNEAERNSLLIAEKKRVIASLRQDIETIDKSIWELDIGASNKSSSLASITRQINLKSLEADLKVSDGSHFALEEFKLSEMNSYGEIQASFQDALKQSKAEHRALEKEVSKADVLLEESNERRVEVKKAYEAMKLEKSNLTETMAKFKEKAKTEENALDDELNEKKNLLLGMKSEENIGIDKLQEELYEAKKNYEAAKLKREEEEKKGQMFLKNVLDKTITYFEDCDKIEKERSAALVSSIKRKLEEIKIVTKEIEDKSNRF